MEGETEAQEKEGSGAQTSSLPTSAFLWLLLRGTDRPPKGDVQLAT